MMIVSGTAKGAQIYLNEFIYVYDWMNKRGDKVYYIKNKCNITLRQMITRFLSINKFIILVQIIFMIQGNFNPLITIYVCKCLLT